MLNTSTGTPTRILVFVQTIESKPSGAKDIDKDRNRMYGREERRVRDESLLPLELSLYLIQKGLHFHS